MRFNKYLEGLYFLIAIALFLFGLGGAFIIVAIISLKEFSFFLLIGSLILGISFIVGILLVYLVSKRLKRLAIENEKQYEMIHELNENLDLKKITLNKIHKETSNEIEHLRSIIDQVDTLVLRLDRNYKVIRVNQAVCRFFKINEADIINKELLEIVGVNNRAVILDLLKAVTENETPVEKEISFTFEDMGELDFTCSLTSNKVINVDEMNQEVLLYTLVCKNISDSKKHKDHIHRLVYYDYLTDLPNRDMLLEDLGKLIKESTYNENKLAVICIGLDEFKKLNDTFGHTRGDMILKAVGKRLARLVDKKYRLYRIGGDEFAIVMENSARSDELMRLLPRISHIFNEAIIVEGNSLYVSASVGIAIHTLHGNDAYELITNANTAMNAIKKSSMVRHAYYKTDMTVDIYKNVQLENALRGSLTRNELYLMYQPQISVSDGEIRGFEALLRWNSPELGLISPTEFIPIMESTHQIIEVGYFVLENACRQLAMMQYATNRNIVMCVNISAIQLVQNDFVQQVRQIINKTGIRGETIELEITESQIINALDQVGDKLDQLKALGIKIALDDFGTGYSSLNYLRNLHCDILKIDKSFINDIGNDAENVASIIEAITVLAKTLSFEVVAEGVETKDQATFLKNIGCDYLQGYYFSKPIMHNELMAMLYEHSYKKIF